MSTKFGLQIDFDLRKTVTSSIRNQTQYWATAAAVLKLYCTWCHYSAAGGQIWRKFCNLMQIELLRYGRSSNRNKNSNMTDVCYSKREIVIIWALLVGPTMYTDSNSILNPEMQHRVTVYFAQRTLSRRFLFLCMFVFVSLSSCQCSMSPDILTVMSEYNK